MFKAAGQTASGEPFLLIGLTEENLTRLKDGKPIPISATELVVLGLPELVIGIVYGETEEELKSRIVEAGIEIHE